MSQNQKKSSKFGKVFDFNLGLEEDIGLKVVVFL